MDGFLEGIILLLRFASLVLWLSLSSFTLSISELLLGLHLLLRPLGRLGLPVEDLVLIVEVTLRFIPFLTQSAERIVKAQASRGAAWGKGSGDLLQRVRQALPMIVPLFLNSLRRAENMALAMDARGYGGSAARTSMYELHFRFVDWLGDWGEFVAACVDCGLAVDKSDSRGEFSPVGVCFAKHLPEPSFTDLLRLFCLFLFFATRQSQPE